MNKALLVKWWWKFKDPTYHSKWKLLIFHIYSAENTNTPFSPFWSAIMKLDTLGSCSVQYTPGSSSLVRFWTDIWLDNCAIASLYPQLYENCINKDVLFSEVIHSQGQNVLFREVLDGVALSEWNHMLTTLSHIYFTHTFDKLALRWDSKGSFTVKSPYIRSLTIEASCQLTPCYGGICLSPPK